MLSTLLCHSEVKLLLEQERRHVNQLGEQVSGLQMEISTLQEDYQNKEEALKRENEVLREQLKKYVSLVQAQRKETITKQTPAEGISVCMCSYVCMCVTRVVWVCILNDLKTSSFYHLQLDRMDRLFMPVLCAM